MADRDRDSDKDRKVKMRGVVSVSNLHSLAGIASSLALLAKTINTLRFNWFCSAWIDYGMKSLQFSNCHPPKPKRTALVALEANRIVRGFSSNSMGPLEVSVGTDT